MKKKDQETPCEIIFKKYRLLQAFLVSLHPNEYDEDRIRRKAFNRPAS